MTYTSIQTHASLRHEINNSLTLLSSRLQLLAAKYPFLTEDSLFAELQNDLTDMQQLLTYDRIGHQPQLSLCHFDDLLNSLCASFLPVLHDKQIEFHLHIAPELPAIRADLTMMRQALINLLKNASEASLPGGYISLSADFDDNSLILSVSDHGKGMTPEQQAHIFDPFVSYKTGGTGLGLSIVQSIVLAHHGHLSVETSPDIGSTFRILLPLPLSAVKNTSQ